ncbi:uncharacterized protein MONOS_3121 [Monocercomonoides exilis]|uniref:uncharacterized protein n=1 Tax=Monocercomonoides exilis TaxID=2049356 RepID=UPI003559AB72|nr:hypothetical protein MONOS_3121 [Monocercomonoides exilis]|eukprot:MONOS_3121.1-p1 / transcript=MONOS_3121.1 / gene=MONOS_3121 / organism=Monocercomonoides_exilis_PA203 / gene_product=unspecified product / transcript_product=unspecified product / location=Mono_scaffold00070:133535-134506(-) / protein_length=308 / sequence_SO=supercontig / SO=protein_coding / is_pseudo=false
MDANGEGESMVVSNVHFSFTNLSFSLPNELVSQSSLIHSALSSATSLSIMRCSFDCEDSTKDTKYCLMKTDGGSFVEFTADVMMVDVVNVSVSNTTISGNSLISLSQPSPTNMLISNERVNTRQTVRVNSSSFVNITCLENRASVMSVVMFSSGMECVIGDVRMVSMRREKAMVHFEGKMEERGKERSMLVLVNESVVERCLFVFGEMFESTYKYVAKVKDGRTVMNEYSFDGSSTEMGKRLKNTLVGEEGGEMDMVRCTIRHIHHCGRLVVICGESRVIMSETRIGDVESEGDVVVVEEEARVSVK